MFGSYVNLRYHMMSDSYCCEVTGKSGPVQLPYIITPSLPVHNSVSQCLYYSDFFVYGKHISH